MNPSILATISIFVGLLAVVLSTKMRIGYLISPFSVSILMLVAIFGVRPLVIDYTSGPRLYGYETNNGVAEGTLIGLIAILAVICGYVMLSGLKIKEKTMSETEATGMSTAAARLGAASIKAVFVACFAYIVLWAAIMAIFDFGYLGVAILGIIIGILAKLFESAIQRRAGFGLLAVLILGALPATAIRGNYPSQLWIAVSMFLTSCVLIWAIGCVTKLRNSRNVSQSSAVEDPPKLRSKSNSMSETRISR